MTNIKDMIYEIRGQYVMLDSDLAKIYQCKNGTKEINQAVKNNIHKFPDRFSWLLSMEQYEEILRSKILTSSSYDNHGGRRYKVRVFTEQGVWMLSTILKSKVAYEVNIQIMDAFVLMRKYISSNLLEQKYINNQVMKNTEDIKLLQDSFSKFEEKKKVNEIYFKGQIYDAYSKILDILKEANKEIVIIDSFLDKTILDMVRNIEVKVILITSNKSKLKEIDIEKYNMEYSNLEVRYNDTYHDRYIFIDRKIIYHLGASINHAGSKTFSINILEDEIVKSSLLNYIFK